jgi:hypothetical protein
MRRLLRRTIVLLVLAVAGVLALAAYPALGDPVNGDNATPGTLTCGGITHPTTSGSGAALAIQLTAGAGFSW